jgi:hypothetical protein
MAVMSPRESWTDERLDDLAKHIDSRFDAQQKYMDARFEALERTMQIGFTLIGVTQAAIIGLVATLL